MNTDDMLTDIIQKLNDNRSKLSALFSLYNSSILSAEDSRVVLSSYFNIKQDLFFLSNTLWQTGKYMLYNLRYKTRKINY